MTGFYEIRRITNELQPCGLRQEEHHIAESVYEVIVEVEKILTVAKSGERIEIEVQLEE